MGKFVKQGAVPGSTDNSIGGSQHPNRNHVATKMGYSSSFDMGNKMTAHERHAGPNGGENASMSRIPNRKPHVAGTKTVLD